MYKKFLVYCIGAGMLMGGFVGAFSSYEGNTSDVKISVPVYDDYYVAGANVKISSDIQGDLIAAGGNVTIEGIVNQDLIVAGGMVRIQGIVKDDMRVAGGEVTINATIEDDLIVAGGEVIIDKNARIKGDVLVLGGQVEILGIIEGKLDVAGGSVAIEGTVNGSATIESEAIVMGQKAHIQGDMNYTTMHEVTNMKDFVQGKVVFTQALSQQSFAVQQAGDFITSRSFSKRIFLVAFGMLLYFGCKNTIQYAGEYGIKKPGKAFLKGIGFLAITPLVLLLLLVSFVGIGFALVGVAIYIFVRSILGLLATVTLTHVVMTKLLPVKKYIILTEVAVIVVLGAIFARIPVLPVLVGIWSLGCYMSLHVLVNKPKSLV